MPVVPFTRGGEVWPGDDRDLVKCDIGPAAPVRLENDSDLCGGPTAPETQ